MLPNKLQVFVARFIEALAEKQKLFNSDGYFVTDSRGSFQLKTKEEVEKIKQGKQEMDKRRAQTAWLGGSILDRSTRSNTAHNPNAIITLPPNYTMDAIPVRDMSSASTNNSPASFDVPVIQVNNDSLSRTPKHDENDNEKPRPSNSLLVPDRVSVEYRDDDKEEGLNTPMSPTAGLSIPVPSIAVSNQQAGITILLSKKRTSLGQWFTVC